MSSRAVDTPPERDAQVIAPHPAKQAPTESNPLRYLRLHPEMILVPGTAIVVIVAWQLAISWFKVPEILLPAPFNVAKSIWLDVTGPLWGRESVYYHFSLTAFVAFASFVVGSIAGVLIGILMYEIRLVNVALSPYITAFQSLPRVAVAPLFVVWFGQNMESKVIIGATICFLPVLISTIAGLRSVDRDMVDMLRGFSASRLQMFTKVQFTYALPHIFAGLQTAIVFSIVAAIIAEWVGSTTGLGALLLIAQNSMDVPRTFGVLLYLSLMGLLFNAAMAFVRKKVLFWAEEQPGADS